MVGQTVKEVGQIRVDSRHGNTPTDITVTPWVVVKSEIETAFQPPQAPGRTKMKTAGGTFIKSPALILTGKTLPIKYPELSPGLPAVDFIDLRKVRAVVTFPWLFAGLERPLILNDWASLNL